MTLTQKHRADVLGSCRLFAGAQREDLAALAEVATEIRFPTGHVIARQGEIGTGFFVVVDGRVRVARDGRTIAELGPGEFFGELSVIDQLPRNAQVAAIEPTTCVALASWDFERTLLSHPSMALAIIRGLAARLREITEQHRI